MPLAARRRTQITWAGQIRADVKSAPHPILHALSDQKRITHYTAPESPT
jgi:hypothetical protein